MSHEQQADPVLSKMPVCSSGDNPHEVWTTKCSCCASFLSGSRQQLQEAGCQMAIEPRLPGHTGFLLCPECSPGEYLWSDLY